MDELREITKEALKESLSLQDTAEGWLYWFGKRGDRLLKDAAKLGYYEVILDLPIEIAVSMDHSILAMIRKELRLITKCTVSFIEDEYQNKPLAKLLISWK